MTKLDDTKLPWLPLVVADYQRDTRHLSLSARGAWTDILCAMHVAQNRGVVRFNRLKLARFLGATVDQADAILEELRDPHNATGHAVADYRELEDGHFELVSRRMVRDEQRRTTNRANGARGGNPVLKGSRLTDSDNRDPNPRVNPPVNPKSQSQSQTGEVSPDPSGAGGAKTRRKRSSSAVPLPEIPEPLDTPEFRRVWGLFVGHREQTRHPLTANAVMLTFERLMRMGVDRAVEAIKHSAANGWRGIHEPSRSFPVEQKGTHHAAAARPARPTAAERGEYAERDEPLPTL